MRHLLKCSVFLLMLGVPTFAQTYRVCIDLQNQLCDVSLTSLEMGPTPVGGNSVAILEFSNDGNANLVMNYSLSSPAFSFQGAPPNPLTVPPAVTLKEPIQFAPTAAGRVTGQFTSTDNAPGSPHILPVSGTGVNVPATDFVLMLDPAGPSTITLKSGGTSSFPVYFLAGNSFPPSAQGTIQCSGGRTGSTCTFAVLSFFSTAQQRLVATITTPAQAGPPPALPFTFIFAFLAALTAIFVFSVRRHPRLAMAGALLLASMAMLSCGGGGSSTSTTLPLTFSATSNGITHTLTVPVTIQ